MFVYSSTRGVNTIHKEDCPYVKRIQNKEYLQHYTEKNKVRKKLEPCSCCLSIKAFYSKELDEIMSYAEEHNLRISFLDNMLYIDDKSDHWLLVFSNNVGKLALYHKSKHDIHKEEQAPYETIVGYHRQPGVFGKTIMTFLNFVANHRQITYERTIKRCNKNIRGHEKAIPKDRNTKAKRKKAKKEKRHVRGAKIRKVYELFNFVNKGDIEYTVV